MDGIHLRSRTPWTPSLAAQLAIHPSRATWKLPYRLSDGSIDVKRLPKALQAILSNYRGVKASSITEQNIPTVLLRLAAGVESIERMPHQKADTADVYLQLADVLEQLQ